MNLLQQLAMDEAIGGASSHLESSVTALLFAHSILVGSLLMYITWRVNSGGPTREASQREFREVTQGATQAASQGNRAPAPDPLTSAANVLFICIGMTAVMVLVNDSLARAFAIGAAIALVRFRIKMEGKFLGVALFYGVLTGMACGVNRLDVAWGVALIFAALISVVSFLRRNFVDESEASERAIPIKTLPTKNPLQERNERAALLGPSEQR